MKPARLRAVEFALDTQKHVVEAVENLTAYEAPDLDGALEQLEAAKRELGRAGAHLREAIRERDEATQAARAS